MKSFRDASDLTSETDVTLNQVFLAESNQKVNEK